MKSLMNNERIDIQIIYFGLLINKIIHKKLEFWIFQYNPVIKKNLKWI